VCADAHTPARGARIVVMPAGETGRAGESEAISGLPHIANTGLDGTFLVQHLPPGEYVVVAAAAGYLSPLDGIIAHKSGDQKAMNTLLRENAPLVRITGQEVAILQIELRLGAILSGRVVYSDGSPATQTQILPQNLAMDKTEGKRDDLVDVGAGMGSLLLRRVPRTDDQGRFRISGIAGGRYRLAVIQNLEVGLNFGEAMFVELNPGITRSDKLAVYGGNTFHQKEAKVYELRAGDIVDGIEIVLPLAGVHSVRGVATGKDGAPLNFGEVKLSDTTDPNLILHTSVQEGGEFRFIGIPEGTYEINITSGLILENPPPYEMPTEQMPEVLRRFKPLRAFAETKVAVTVQTSDIDDVAVTLADTRLPDNAAPAAPPEKTQDDVVVAPQT
jgi:hypothetical protein